MFLRNPRLPIDAAFKSVHRQPVEAVQKMIERRHAVDVAVKTHIERANRYASAYANRRRRHLEFAVDDQVLLSTAHLPLPPPLTRKLAPRWLGPLRVIERIGAVAYRLELPPSLTRLHNVFHVSLLRRFEGTAPAPRPPVFACGDDEEFEL